MKVGFSNERKQPIFKSILVCNVALIGDSYEGKSGFKLLWRSVVIYRSPFFCKLTDFVRLNFTQSVNIEKYLGESVSMSITLEPEQERFIQEQVARGRFKSAHEVLAHALMLLEEKYREDEAWIEDVRQKVDAAKAQVERGEVLPLETVMAQLHDKFRQAREDRD
jgi:antitoxin ParD1/3/4